MNVIMILLILAVFGALLNFASKGAIIRGKKMYWMGGAYLAVLLIAVVLHFFVLEKEDSKARDLHKEKIPRLEQVVHGHKAIETIAPYLVDQHLFEFESDELAIDSVMEDYRYVPVLIERTGAGGNIIEVDYYQGPTIIEGIDVTEQMEEMDIYVNDDELFISTTEFIHINLSVYKNDFPMRQFTGETLFANDEYPFDQPNDLVHVRIPEHIKTTIAEDVNYYNMNN